LDSSGWSLSALIINFVSGRSWGGSRRIAQESEVLL
jgi:hypothetical protein